jgi:hypothetical protein
MVGGVREHSLEDPCFGLLYFLFYGHCYMLRMIKENGKHEKHQHSARLQLPASFMFTV